MRHWFERLKLSRQLALVSCLFILIPMLLLWFTILRSQQDSAIQTRLREAQSRCAQAQAQVQRAAELCNMSAQVFLNTPALVEHLHMLKQDVPPDAAELLEFYRTHVSSLEKIILSNPDLYQIRVYIKNYVALMNLRFDYVVSLKEDIPLELLGQLIPKVSLQPIVENAVIHGAAALAADSTITLTGVCDRAKGRFTVRIADQGQGMGPEALERLRRQIAGEEPARSSSGNGIGLKNVQDRIQMAYGPGYGLRVESQPGGGTAVTVSFPFQEPREDSP